MKRIKQFLCILLLSFSILGCGNPMDDMINHYNQGNYLKSAEAAIEAFKNKEFRPKVISFMRDNGDRVIDKAIIRGEQMMISHKGTQKPVHYFEALHMVLNEIKILDFPVNSIDSAIAKTIDKCNISINYFMDHQYGQMQRAYSNKRYRKCARIADKIKSYDPDYKKTSFIYDKALRQARRNIQFKQFTYNNPILNAAIIDWMKGNNVDASKVMSADKVGSISVRDYYNSEISRNIADNKSDFLNFFISDENGLYRKIHYKIKGDITAKENIDKVEYTDSKTKKVTKNNKYTVDVIVNAKLYLKGSKQQIANFNFTESSTGEYRADWSIPKDDLVKNAVEKSVKHLFAKINKVIDRDLDPYALQREL